MTILQLISCFAIAPVQAIFPILVGRPHPAGHLGYPHMGPYFSVHGGAGVFPSTPSPPTNAAAIAFLRDKAPGALPPAALEALESTGIAEVVHRFMSVQVMLNLTLFSIHTAIPSQKGFTEPDSAQARYLEACCMWNLTSAFKFVTVVHSEKADLLPSSTEQFKASLPLPLLELQL